MIVKLATGNVRACLRDFAVYFATLTCAACLLYAFTASTDYLALLDLDEGQRANIMQAGGILQGFSVFSVVVFVFLIGYANRFLVRRRKREFGLYKLLGLRESAIAAILALESAVVGAASLVSGIAIGTILSPACGFVAAFVFGVPWKLSFVFAPHAAWWTAGCFAVIACFAALIAMRDVRRRPLIDLLNADRTPERLRTTSNVGSSAQRIGAGVLLAIVWGSCVFAPGVFIALIIPMGFAAVFGTLFVFRLAAARASRKARHNPGRYLSGLRPVTVRRIEATVESSCAAMSCVCVLVAAAVCMICAGLAFSIGMRGGAELTLLASNIAPIGYIGIFYGVTFLVAATAVLALQQLVNASDAQKEYRFLAKIGADERDIRRSVRAQIALYFVAPCAFALVHDVFGLTLVALLAFAVGSGGFLVMVGCTIALVIAIMGIYGTITARSCERVLIGR